MIEKTAQSDLFKQQMHESLRQETLHSTAITIAKNDNVYTCGDQGELVYFIESGQIKLLMLSPDERECLLAIHSAGDIFGELCLSGLGVRLETATAMEESVLKQIPSRKFFARLGCDALFEGFVRYLAVRVANQQQVIANLVTADSERRLGKTLLRIAQTFVEKDRRSILHTMRSEPEDNREIYQSLCHHQRKVNH
jgi:CRP-like cAMP-binding protein